MDINNNQQINTFTKGMNTDVSDMLMDNSQYRYAKNVRLSQPDIRTIKVIYMYIKQARIATGFVHMNQKTVNYLENI